MAILINEETQVMVQGITGREAQLRVELMGSYGTRVVAGVTPGKGGQEVMGVPVYDTVAEAVENHPGISATCIFVPARVAKQAAMEAIDAGIRVISLHPERVPQQDMLEIIAYSRGKGVTVIGPNTIGVISPGKALIGMIGGNVDFARQCFRPGRIGVLSRSGGNTTTLSYYLTRAGFGQSTAVSVGGDAFIGATWCDLLALFEKDPETQAVAVFGEIGTTTEEDAAAFIKQGGFTKPMVAYVAGRYARPNMRFGHAGAIISRGTGAAEGKIEALRSAGVHVVDHFGDIGEALKTALAGH